MVNIRVYAANMDELTSYPSRPETNDYVGNGDNWMGITAPCYIKPDKSVMLRAAV